MSDYTDDVIDGVFCHMCGEYLGDGVGYPRGCPGCEPSEAQEVVAALNEGDHVRQRVGKVSCPICRKMVKTKGLEDHMRAKHGGG